MSSEAGQSAGGREPVADWSEEDTSRDASAFPNTNDLAYTVDKRFFRMVIWFAGCTLLLSVGGMVGLAAFDKEIPEGIVAAASGLIGLLTGTFAARASRGS